MFYPLNYLSLWFNTLDELYTAITIYTHLNGYGISKLYCKTNSKSIYRADFSSKIFSIIEINEDKKILFI